MRALLGVTKPLKKAGGVLRRLWYVVRVATDVILEVRATETYDASVHTTRIQLSIEPSLLVGRRCVQAFELDPTRPRPVRDESVGQAGLSAHLCDECNHHGIALVQ